MNYNHKKKKKIIAMRRKHFLAETSYIKIPVFDKASTLDRSLLFCTTGVSFRSTSLRLLELLDLAIPVNSEVVLACAISMANLASAGKNNLANATEQYSNQN